MAKSYHFDENGNEILPEPKSVSQINEYIKCLLEEEMLLQDLYVSAEISNFKHHSTGHMYFTLKDERSEIRAVMFRAHASRIVFKPENGMRVLVHARIGVYEKTGSYQLYVDAMQPEGLGSLYLAFEQLKSKLASEGLFDEAHKKPIPKFPSKIGIITSPTGAAVRDIIKICKRRCPFIKLILFPSAVQGAYAADELVRAVEYFNATDYVDLIIIGRGGGSIEDLWAFNDETLARSVYNSKIPIISAVGHEIDFTICDFVADVRAATPSHAAELATPNTEELKNRVSVSFERAYNSIINTLSGCRYALSQLEESKALKKPQLLLDAKKTQLSAIVKNMSVAMKSQNNEHRLALSGLSSALNALSPLSVISRGYGAVFDSEGKVIKSISDVEKNQKIHVKMSDGTINATVNGTEKEKNDAV